jgi:hypothetical protein
VREVTGLRAHTGGGGNCHQVDRAAAGPCSSPLAREPRPRALSPRRHLKPARLPAAPISGRRSADADLRQSRHRRREVASQAPRRSAASDIGPVGLARITGGTRSRPACTIGDALAVVSSTGADNAAQCSRVNYAMCRLASGIVPAGGVLAGTSCPMAEHPHSTRSWPCLLGAGRGCRQTWSLGGGHPRVAADGGSSMQRTNGGRQVPGQQHAVLPQTTLPFCHGEDTGRERACASGPAPQQPSSTR